jgi:hypothetical protein
MRESRGVLVPCTAARRALAASESSRGSVSPPMGRVHHLPLELGADRNILVFWPTRLEYHGRLSSQWLAVVYLLAVAARGGRGICSAAQPVKR